MLLPVTPGGVRGDPVPFLQRLSAQPVGLVGPVVAVGRVVQRDQGRLVNGEGRAGRLGGPGPGVRARLRGRHPHGIRRIRRQVLNGVWRGRHLGLTVRRVPVLGPGLPLDRVARRPDYRLPGQLQRFPRRGDGQTGDLSHLGPGDRRVTQRRQQHQQDGPGSPQTAPAGRTRTGGEGRAGRSQVPYHRYRAVRRPGFSGDGDGPRPSTRQRRTPGAGSGQSRSPRTRPRPRTESGRCPPASARSRPRSPR